MRCPGVVLKRCLVDVDLVEVQLAGLVDILVDIEPQAARLLAGRAQAIERDRRDEGVHLVRLDGQRSVDNMQTAGKRGVLHGARAGGIPVRIAQRIHRPAERDLYGTIQHGLHHSVPLLEVRCGLVVFERRLIAVDFIKGKQRGVGLVLDDVEAAAMGLVEDRAGAVGNRGLDKVVDVVLLDFEPNHKDVHSNSLPARLEAR